MNAVLLVIGAEISLKITVFYWIKLFLLYALWVTFILINKYSSSLIVPLPLYFVPTNDDYIYKYRNSVVY